MHVAVVLWSPAYTYRACPEESTRIGPSVAFVATCTVGSAARVVEVVQNIQLTAATTATVVLRRRLVVRRCGDRDVAMWVADSS